MRAFLIARECEAETVRPYLGEGDVVVVAGIGKEEVRLEGDAVLLMRGYKFPDFLQGVLAGVRVRIVPVRIANGSGEFQPDLVQQ